MQDSDEVTFLIEHNEDMNLFNITISSPSAMLGTELAACMRSLAEDIDKDPAEFMSSFNAVPLEIN